MKYETKKQEFLYKWNKENNKKRSTLRSTLILTAIGAGMAILGAKIWLNNKPAELGYKNSAGVLEKVKIKKEILRTKEDILLREDYLRIFENKRKYLGISTPKTIVKEDEIKLYADQKRLTKYQRIEKNLKYKYNKSRGY